MVLYLSVLWIGYTVVSNNVVHKTCLQLVADTSFLHFPVIMGHCISLFKR